MEMTAEQVADCTILLAEVGSRVLGVSIEGTDDQDLMGICVEPPDYVIGLNKFEHLIERTAAEGVRSGPGDVDKATYSLRKWMRLALKGNPTVLMPLFAPESACLLLAKPGRVLREHGDKFRSKESGHAFLNYMVSQRTQLTGERPKKHTNRPELVAQYGFDTKFAYHALRLGIQGIEFMERGRLELPLREPDRQELLAIRRGEIELVEILEKMASVERSLRQAVERVPNERADHTWANEFLKEAYGNAWGW